MSLDSVNFLWKNTLKWTGAILKLISINYIFFFLFEQNKTFICTKIFYTDGYCLIRMLGSNRDLISLYF